MAITVPTLADVVAARARIAAHAVVTPLIRHPALDAATGGRILLKVESLQRVGAFKFRGAYNKIAQVDRMRFPGGVVACSSGNHAQGVAAAATICGLKSLIVMPKDAPMAKLARTKAFGGEVRPYDRLTEDREAIARAECEKRQACLVLPYDDPDVIAGQGTAGLEIAEQAEAVGLVPEAVLAPVSGGGLVGGIALAMERLAPRPQVFGVEPAGFDDLARSLASGRHERNAALSGSICDALLAATPGEITFEIAKRRLAGSIAVSDEETRAAMRFAFHELKLVLEPGGAIALGAVLAGKLPTAGRTIAVVLSGGNVDAAQFAAIIGGSA